MGGVSYFEPLLSASSRFALTFLLRLSAKLCTHSGIGGLAPFFCCCGFGFGLLLDISKVVSVYDEILARQYS